MPDPATPRRRRRAFVATVPVVLVLGAGLRFGLSGWIADVTGGLAYTALIYLLAGVFRPAWTPAKLTAVAIGLSVAVELAQLTGGPQALVGWWSPMRLAVGQSFSATDLPVYVAGGLLAWAVDARTAAAAGATARRREETAGGRAHAARSVASRARDRPDG